MTSVVVLAAGLGRRLASAGPQPKWLVPVHDSCPATAQLDAFGRVGVESVHVVVGPGADAIEAHVAPWRDHLALDLVANPMAAERNNWYSLLLGLDACSLRPDADVVVVNSDLYAAPGWFEALLTSVAGSAAPSALAIDPTRGRTDEAMKVQLDGDGDHVTGIGKVGIDAPGGEYVGLARWTTPAASELRDVLARFASEPDRADNWYEHAIQCHIDAGAQYAAVAVPGDLWVEIDDQADLDAAERLPRPSGTVGHASRGGAP